MLTTGDTVLSESYVESKSTILTPLQWLHQVLQEQDVEDYCGPLSIPYFSLDYEKVKLIWLLCTFSIVHQWGNGAKQHICLCRDSKRNYEDYKSINSISPASNLFHQNQNNNRLKTMSCPCIYNGL